MLNMKHTHKCIDKIYVNVLNVCIRSASGFIVFHVYLSHFHSPRTTFELVHIVQVYELI